MSTPAGNAGISAQVQLSRLRANLEHLFALGKEEGREGAWRLAFSPADVRGRTYVLEVMQESGLAPRVDPAGNLIGTRRGTDPELPALIIGSHIDTVPGGGMFDGALGVLGGVEVLRAMHDARYQAAHTLEVIAFSNEEKARFQGPGGSSAMVKGIEAQELEGVRDAEGKPLTEAMREAGVDPAGIAAARRPAGFCGGYLELHVEQGGRMAAEGTQVGVVTAIVGISRARLSFQGRANHAGTTAMRDRRDALWGAAEFVGDVRRAAFSEEGNLVGTVGALNVSPGAANVVPGQVDLTLELRSADEARVQRVLETLLARAEAAAKSHGLKLLFSASRVGRAVPMDPGVQDEIEAAAGELALRHVRLTSWAGHDASHFSPIAPTGMIFVPSIGGISHAPEESTSWEDAGAGVKVLAETVCRLDRLAVRAKRP